MLPDPFGHALVLTGPTASGKTRLGVEIAERLGAEIVSMDSMALYRDMDVGTAKPGPEEQRRVRHHLIDVLDPSESASVAWWLERAADCCRDIERRGRRVLFVGGTPLYLKALICGLFHGPPADPGLRQQLAAEAERLGPQALHARLARVDSVTASRLHPNDLRRVIRALEVWQLTGRPISDWQTQWRDTRGQFPPRIGTDHRPSTAHGQLPPVLWLDLPRHQLYARIDTRVCAMIAAGLVEEVEALRRRPLPLSPEAAQALGYKEVIDYLEGRTTHEETVRRIQQRSRHFAKRQITWFRHLPHCQPVTEPLTFATLGLTMK
jgi:tRNA dimethylallyltransferase